MDTGSNEIIHNKPAQRFEIHVGELMAELKYNQAGNTLTFSHTRVPRALEGQGIGGQLVKTGLDYARNQRLEVVPLCSFVEAYIQRHPEYQSLVRLPGAR